MLKLGTEQRQAGLLCTVVLRFTVLNNVVRVIVFYAKCIILDWIGMCSVLHSVVLYCRVLYCMLRVVLQYCTFFSFFFFNLTYSRWISSLPSCLWSQRIFPSLPGSRLTILLSRCKFSTLTTRQPMVEFYLLTFPRFPLRKKEHKSYFGKNPTQDFRTSRCCAIL